MPQLNILPVNVSKNIELKGDLTSFNSTTSKDDFSKYIDLHRNKNKTTESNSNVESVMTTVDSDKKINSPSESTLNTNKSDNLVRNSDTIDESDLAAIVQKVAAPGDTPSNKGEIKPNKIDQKALLESEQLMSFLTKADNTLIKQSIDPSLPEQPLEEQKIVEQKDKDEAQLLLNASNLVAELSAVAKAVVNDRVGVAVAPTHTEQVISAKEQLVGVKSSVEVVIEGRNKDVTKAEAPVVLTIPIENNSVRPELKSESTTEVKLTNTNSDKTNISQQIKVDHAQVSNDKIIQDARKKESNQSGQVESLINGQLSENKEVSTSTVTQVNLNNQGQSDSVSSLEKTVGAIEKQKNLSKQIQHEKVSSLSELQLTKSELTQSSETKINDTVNFNVNKTASVSNQPVTNNLSHDDAIKVQAKQAENAQLSASLSMKNEQNQQQLTSQNEDDVFVEGEVIAGVKRERSVTENFNNINAKVTATPQEIIERQSERQSVEMLNANPSAATEITQSQKTNVQLHQETISLFRKDFTEAVKDKVMLMISQKLQRFDITLDPPELGNMQVRVNLQGEQAVVNFLVQSQQTKDALEQNMHKLRELLAEQGVDVGDANVEQQTANDEGSTAGYNSQKENEIVNVSEANDVVAHTLSAQLIDSSTATVDYYA